ncbi:taste receptor type 2 member 40-like [Pelodytes ibericus]
MEDWEQAMLVFQSAAAIIGLVDNGYIIALCGKGRGKVRSFSPKELLLLSLSSVNLVLQIASLFTNVFSYMWPQIYFLNYVAKLFLFFCLVMVSCSLWISAWFCVYRSIKITNGTSKLAAWLLQKMSNKVLTLILGSMFISIIQSLPVSIDMNFIFLKTTSTEGNVTELVITFSSNCFMCGTWAYIAVSLIPFVLFFIATITILCSLWRHMKNMKRNARMSGSPRLDKLYRAVTIVTLLQLTCVLFYVSQCFVVTRYVTYGSSSYMLCIVLISTFPALNAAILIMGNQDLYRPVTDIFKKTYR